MAERIGERIGLPVIELDAIFWLSDWRSKPLERFRADVASALSSHPAGWVCAGNYSNVRDIVLPRADTVVWLRPPFRVALWLLWRRTAKRACGRAALCGTIKRES
ncbi:MAG: adenylate kinase, partial [Chloroflexi bacterium]|nr:adenylate kinase [Chloroflexota bacterium]